jgi:hypothetical protein
LNDVADGFVDGDFGGGSAAWNFAGEDLADFGGDVGVGNEAGGFGAEELSALCQDAFAAVGDEAGANDQVVIDFGGAGDARSDQVDVRPWANPGAFEDGLLGGGYGADDIGAGDSLLDGWRGGDGDGGDLGLEGGGEGAGLFRGAAPEEDAFERTDFGDGAGVSGGLLARAEDGETAGAGEREGIGCDGAGGGRADGGDLAGVEDADGGAGFRMEEDDEALVGLDAAVRIAGAK